MTSAKPEDLIRARGEMADRVRAFDWASTPVGPMEHWPVSLRCAVATMLECQIPMYITWGETFIQFYNDACRPMLGTTKHPQALGTGAQASWPEIWQTLAPMWQDVLKGKAIGLNDFKLTIERHGYPEDVYFNISYSPLRDDSAKVAGILVTYSETTDRVRTERRLNAARDQLRSIFMQMPAAIAILRGSEMRFEFANAAYQSLVAKSEDELIGRKRTDVFPDSPERINSQFSHVYLTGDRLVTSEHSFIRDWNSDGNESERSLNLIFEPYRDVDGIIVGVIIFAFDVTEHVGARRKAQEAEARTRSAHEALREAGRQKDEFLATLAHELRNPLAPLRNAAHALGQSELSPTALAWCRDVISRQVKHMAFLLDDLLDVSRINTGRIELKKEMVRLDAVVNAAVETVAPLISKKQHTLQVDLPGAAVELEADPLRLSQVFTNLLANAVKYTDPGGRIELKAAVDGEGLKVSLSDNGIGIPPEALPNLFRMFSQIPSAIDRTEGGLGIGLALSKGLVALHGGSLGAHSEGAGCGTTFELHLPASVVKLPASPAHPPAGANEASRTQRRVLVVDDNRDAADSLAMLLDIEGHDVTVAYGAEEALSLAPSLLPEVAFLDIGMPTMNGYELARRIRQETWGASMFLVAATGWGTEDDRRKAASAGFDRHLTKPVNPSEVLALLSRENVR
jgi:PAS domain S-box-containing protein